MYKHKQNATVTMYHATHINNVDSIMQHGLTVARATGKISAVWLHTKSKRAWGVLHTQRKYKAQLNQVVILTVRVKRSNLTRRWRGIWSCKANVNNIISITRASALCSEQA